MTRHEAIPRGRMSDRERQIRSAVNRLLSQHGVVHGSLIRRRRTCGKPNCRCTMGHLHESLYLVVTEGRKSRQMYIPAEWEAVVREWIDNYSKTRELMDDLSTVHWEKIRTRRR